MLKGEIDILDADYLEKSERTIRTKQGRDR